MYRPLVFVKGIIGKYLNALTDEINTDLAFIGEVLGTAWRILVKNFGIIIIYSILSVFVLFIIGIFSAFANINKDILIPLIVFFALLFIQAYTTLGLYKLIFTLIDSEYYEFEVSQIVPSFRMIITYVALSIISAAIIAGYNVFLLQLFLKGHGIVEEIFKAIEMIVILYLALRFMFCISYIVDDGSGPIESLKQSFNLTRSNIFKIILLLLAFFVVIAIPAFGVIKLNWKILVLLVIVIYPYINIVLSVVYRKLIHDAKGIDDIISETI